MYYHIRWCNKQNLRIAIKSLFELRSTLQNFNSLWSNSLYGNNIVLKSNPGFGNCYLEHGWMYADAKISVEGFEHLTMISMNPKRLYQFKSQGLSTIDLPLKTYIEMVPNRHLKNFLVFQKGCVMMIDGAVPFKDYILLIPRHSSVDIILNQESITLEKFVKRHLNKKNVVILLHPFDFRNSRTQHYWSKLGAQVVCCGNITSSSFLTNLKSLLSNSEVILSDGIGTHIYYANALGKQVYFYMLDTGMLKRSNKDEGIYARDHQGFNSWDRAEFKLLELSPAENIASRNHHYPRKEIEKVLWDKENI